MFELTPERNRGSAYWADDICDVTDTGTAGSTKVKDLGTRHNVNGIKTTKDAIKYLVMVNEICGEDWLDPDWFRFGASTLLNDLLMQRTKMTTGRYSGPDYFTLD